jgi:hypothetical protein
MSSMSARGPVPFTSWIWQWRLATGRGRVLEDGRFVFGCIATPTGAA